MSDFEALWDGAHRHIAQRERAVNIQGADAGGVVGHCPCARSAQDALLLDARRLGLGKSQDPRLNEIATSNPLRESGHLLPEFLDFRGRSCRCHRFIDDGSAVNDCRSCEGCVTPGDTGPREEPQVIVVVVVEDLQHSFPQPDAFRVDTRWPDPEVVHADIQAHLVVHEISRPRTPSQQGGRRTAPSLRRGILMSD
eukprot:740138-Prymnesium_polylepis.1